MGTELEERGAQPCLAVSPEGNPATDKVKLPEREELQNSVLDGWLGTGDVGGKMKDRVGRMWGKLEAVLP